jgi:hypothetical protein
MQLKWIGKGRRENGEGKNIGSESRVKEELEERNSGKGENSEELEGMEKKGEGSGEKRG